MDRCNVLPETKFVGTRLRVDTTRVFICGGNLPPCGAAGERSEFNIKLPLGAPLMIFSRGYLQKSFPRVDTSARQRGFEIRVFPLLGELPKAIEQHLPVCQLYRWQLGPSMWTSPTTKSLDHIVVTALQVGFPWESHGPATCGFACNCPEPGAWTKGGQFPGIAHSEGKVKFWRSWLNTASNTQKREVQQLVKAGRAFISDNKGCVYTDNQFAVRDVIAECINDSSLATGNANAMLRAARAMTIHNDVDINARDDFGNIVHHTDTHTLLWSIHSRGSVCGYNDNSQRAIRLRDDLIIALRANVGVHPLTMCPTVGLTPQVKLPLRPIYLIPAKS